MPEDSPNTKYDGSAGSVLLARNDYVCAAIEFENTLKSEQTNRKVWHDLLLAYAMSAKFSQFLRAFEQSFRLFSNDLEIGLNVFLSIVARVDGYGIVKKLSSELPNNHPAQILATYHAGCAELQNNNIETAFSRFNTFKNAVIAQKQLFPISTNEIMNVMFRQALLIEHPETVSQIENADDASFPNYTPDLLFDSPPTVPANKLEPVLISCCNGLYFNKYACDLIKSINEHCQGAIVHIHVADPDPETHQTIVELRSTYPDIYLNYSTESGSPFSGNVYYSCNRFLLAERFLELYQTGIMIFDIDGELNADLAQFWNTIKQSDVACFSSGKAEPASVYQAAAIYFAHTADSIRFARLMRKFILMKLALPPGISWMLDQAALFSVIKYLEFTSPEFKFKDLTTSENLLLTNIFTPVEDPDGKLKLMQSGTKDES